MQLVDVVGGLAVAFSTLSITPQLYKTWRIRHADDLSYAWLLSALVGSVLWLVYGSMNADWAVVLSNVVGSALVTTLVVMKWRYARR